MKPADHLGMYLEACMTTPEGRQAILADEKVQRALGRPVNGKALIEAVWSAANKLGPSGGNVVAYLNTHTERANFLQYFDGWISTDDATPRAMSTV
jgi:hypothetical protein